MKKSYENFKDYANSVLDVLKHFRDIIVDYELKVEEVTSFEGLIKGEVVFVDGSRLRFLEYVLLMDKGLFKLRYRYNYTSCDNRLVFRYDNAPHHPEISSFPHHKHTEENRVVPSQPPTLWEVLEEILEHIQ